MANDLRLEFAGSRLERAESPAFLQTRHRGAGGDADLFLPVGYVEVNSVHDVTAGVRSAGDAANVSLSVAPDTVIVLELADGTTVVTSAVRLQQSLSRIADRPVAEDVAPLFLVNDVTGARRGVFGEIAGGLLRRVYTLVVGSAGDPIIADARRALARSGRQAARRTLADAAALGATWLGTKALMWAIEKRLSQAPGLYRWVGSQAAPNGLAAVDAATLADDARQGSLLLLIHGTASSTLGSFANLMDGGNEDWQAIAARFGNRVFAFEHRTLSESPIRNAIELARVLPAGARINLVTHSRGGIVGDLLCLAGIERALIDDFRPDTDVAGEGDADTRRQRRREAAGCYAEHRRDLRELHRLLTRKRFVVERYVRVASPARGTRLASANLDVFLSSMLTVIGWVPLLAGSAVYAAFRRAVIEIVRNRTDARLVPGIEAMLPESPMARLLARAKPGASVAMAVIAGDTEVASGSLLKRLGVLFTDCVFFDGFENDLVVDTDSMYAGIAPSAGARRRFDTGSAVSHFRYFENSGSRAALCEWLTAPDVTRVSAFDSLPDAAGAMVAPSRPARTASVRRRRGADARARPIVVVVPGIMGSHLWINRRDRVWFDPADVLLGGLRRVKWGARDIEAEALFGRFYGALCEFLDGTHEVAPFAYDWRLPLDRLGDQFGLFLARRLRSSRGRPIRILAHSMGGLVARAAIYRRPDIVEPLIERDGARLVMLGTPHQGSHMMVETLIGKADTIRMLGRLDIVNGLQKVLDIVAGFRGALQLLPRTGFIDAGGSAPIENFFRRSNWQLLRRGMRDAWFGDAVAGVPEQTALDEARWLWDQDAGELAEMAGRKVPGVWPSRLRPRAQAYAAKTIQVHGQSARTPCGMVRVGDRWKMLGTPAGDGSVTWLSGTIRGIGANYWMPVEHSALTGSQAHFPAIEDLLMRGETERLPASSPVLRTAMTAPVPYDAGPAPYPWPGEHAAPLLGQVRRRAVPTARPSLSVSVRAMDLRFVTSPILAGHYELDPISGAEAIIDSQLVGRRLSERYRMGMYAGAVGTVVVVLPPQNDAERRRGSLQGAVITGLGPLDGTLSEARLTEAVHAGVLRFLMHHADCVDSPDDEVRLSSLLLGYNSSANLGIKAAVAALVNGVNSANQKYRDAAQRPLRVGALEIVELYVDTALSTVYALRELVAGRQAGQQRVDVDLDLCATLQFGPGWRHRLDDSRGAGYWPRLMITDADRDEADVSPAGPMPPASTDMAQGVARRLRYIQIGQRARAETIIRQRQPGAVEALVERQIGSNAYDRDFCRTLFQLMVPHEFKDTARQLQRIVLVLDAYTANLPWELMLTDDTPLSVRTQVVRQLVSTRFRTQVRPTRGRHAYVIGNPSTEGFHSAFPDCPAGPASDGLASLMQAEAEARSVVGVLQRNGFEVATCIGTDRRALDVLNPLYRSEFRVIHIAAHGIVGLRHRDGSQRTGVVLSRGLLITAAEIEAMERVPDLVFLNCCHLARINASTVAYNRLAYSLARELMEIGVRCVVAAGWPVDDHAAASFAVAFYDALLTKGMPFGDAVFEARVRNYTDYPTGMTWGAYQAYGDPGWQIGGDAAAINPPVSYVSPIELAERIARFAIDLNEQGRIPDDAAAGERIAEIERILQRGASAWRQHPQVLTALGDAYAQLGPRCFEAARSCYGRAIASDDRQGHVPIRAIEQLANIEARHGELCNDIALIDAAIRRIESLIASVESGGTGLPANRQRRTILGSAFKRQAACHARAVVGGGGVAAGRAFRDALGRSIRCYEAAADAATASMPVPYPTINALALRSVRGDVPADAETLIDRCIQVATADFARTAAFWDAVVVADAECVRAIIEGKLAEADEDGDAALERVKAAYASSLAHVPVHPKRMNTVVGQVRLLALFHQAEGRHGRSRAALVHRLERLAAWLAALVEGRDAVVAVADNAPRPHALPGPDDGGPPSGVRPGRAGRRRHRRRR